MKDFDFDSITAKEIVEIANKKGEEFRKINTNQLRNFFNEVVSIKNNMLSMNEFNFSLIESKLILLKPKLAYAAGRQNTIKLFKTFMDEVIDAVLKAKDKKKAIENFITLNESIIAYHKFYGGKD
jgi:CRISPR-associated protein Csm2